MTRRNSASFLEVVSITNDPALSVSFSFLRFISGDGDLHRPLVSVPVFATAIRQGSSANHIQK